ncbi:MAG TPA: 50S ribosomal protein L18 [Candidatus Xenobia bacterium]|jgi:large subunit ribosomal protein L18
MIHKPDAASVRARRHRKIRRSLSGTTQRPRLAVFRSLKHIYAQLIDDEEGTTVAAASTLDKELKTGDKATFVQRAKQVGELVAQRAKAKGVEAVVFDRAGYKYHGRVAAVADGVRAQGLTV